MSSSRRIQASRANCRLSRGPASAEGKKLAAQNAMRHGLLARCVVIESESAPHFDALLNELLRRIQPSDGMEFGMVEEMAAAYWRMRRAWALETRLLDTKANAHAEGDAIDRMAAAISDPAAAPALALLHRYEARLHLMYQRGLHNLFRLRAVLPNEPNPISEHSAIATDSALPEYPETPESPAPLPALESC